MANHPDSDESKPGGPTLGVLRDKPTVPADFDASLPEEIQAAFDGADPIDQDQASTHGSISTATHLPSWDIRLEGRSWSRPEMHARLAALPVKLEVVGGKLCLGAEQRLLLLGALLESTGLELAVRLGDAKCWQNALDARAADEQRVDESAQPASVSLEPDALAALASADNTENHRSAESRRTWNYRVMSFKHGEDAWQAIHEVHYRDGIPIAYSESPAKVLWDSDEGGVAGGLGCLERMKEALLKPVLTEAEFRE